MERESGSTSSSPGNGGGEKVRGGDDGASASPSTPTALDTVNATMPNNSITMTNPAAAMTNNHLPSTSSVDAGAAMVSRLSFSGLLNAIDGVAAQEGRLLFLTTNHVNRLSHALIRPGRVDVRCEFKLATAAQMKKIFVSFYKDLPPSVWAASFGNESPRSSLVVAGAEEEEGGRGEGEGDGEEGREEGREEGEEGEDEVSREVLEILKTLPMPPRPNALTPCLNSGVDLKKGGLAKGGAGDDDGDGISNSISNGIGIGSAARADGAAAAAAADHGHIASREQRDASTTTSSILSPLLPPPTLANPKGSASASASSSSSSLSTLQSPQPHHLPHHHHPEDHQGQTGLVDDRTLTALAEVFARRVPEDAVSMAALQGHLMVFKMDPWGAVRQAKERLSREGHLHVHQLC